MQAGLLLRLARYPSGEVQHHLEVLLMGYIGSFVV
jgi:hypothetical protein